MNKVRIGIIGTGYTIGIANAHHEFKGEEGHEGLINEFVHAILDGKPVNRGLERGLYIQYVLDMLRKSAETGSKVIL